jgi:nitroimidazol reductase NimA-like FMN-containing flavoprotein (pyridoxamine 5'-phosphate oxidase superfamily)
MTESQNAQRGGVRELSVPECWARLRQSVVGRVAVVRDGRPEIFPVNFVVDHGTVVLRTGSGTLFQSLDAAPAAFEVDGYAVGAATAWSVVVKGKAREVVEIQESLDAMRLPLFPWQAGLKPHFVRIEPAELTGREFEVAGGRRSDPPAPSASPE